MPIYRPPKDEQFFIIARIIIEVMAIKPEITTQVLKDYVKSIENPATAPELRVMSYEIAEPKKQKDGTFTNFVEIEMKFASVGSMIGYCFDALPASIDIVEPDELKFESTVLTGLLNDLQARLHTINFELSKLKGNYKILEENSVGLFRNFLIHVLREHPLPEQELARVIGVSPESLAGLLKKYISPGLCELRDGEYVLLRKD